MTAEFQEDALQESIRIYASRLARLCFLRHRCDDDHPVLLTEQELVEMARSRLQEQAVMRFGQDLEAKSYLLAATIRRLAAKWIVCTIDDEDERDVILTAIHQENVAAIFQRAS
jgi:hypothetical protein